jgi:hypothetical protein
VIDHRYVLLDKAVAVLTDSEERQSDLDERRKANRQDHARAALAGVVEDLAGVDVGGIEDAQRAHVAAERMLELERTAVELGERLRGLREREHEHRAAAAESRVEPVELDDGRAALVSSQQARDVAADAAKAAMVALRDRERDEQDLQATLQEACRTVDQGVARALSFVRSRRERRVTQSEALVAEARAVVEDARVLHEARTEDRVVSQFGFRLQIVPFRPFEHRRR